VSLESHHGWNDLYLSLGAWPERIAEAVNGSNRERDERDFYLSFFVQCHSLRDWSIKSGTLDKELIDKLIQSCDCMVLCRDIANRYKHLKINKPGMDADWSLWADYDEAGEPLNITAKGKTWLAWDLMIECLSFWEMVAAAYNLGERKRVFRPS